MASLAPQQKVPVLRVPRVPHERIVCPLLPGPDYFACVGRGPRWPTPRREAKSSWTQPMAIGSARRWRSSGKCEEKGIDHRLAQRTVGREFALRWVDPLGRMKMGRRRDKRMSRGHAWASGSAREMGALGDKMTAAAAGGIGSVARSPQALGWAAALRGLARHAHRTQFAATPWPQGAGAEAQERAWQQVWECAAVLGRGLQALCEEERGCRQTEALCEFAS